MNITATPNKEGRTPTAEEKKLIESLSSLAALFGNSLFYYGRSVLNISFDQYEEIEAAAQDNDIFTLAKDPEKEELEAAAASAKGTTFEEPESPGTQVLQALTLMHPDVRAALGTSAIYQIFSDALKHHGRIEEDLEDQIHGMNLVALAGLWITTKRVFALGHQQDCFRIFDAMMKGIVEKKLEPLPDLEEITTEDRHNMDAFYVAYYTWNLPSITTFPATDKIYISTSLASRTQHIIAKKGFFRDKDGKEGTILNVGTEKDPVYIRMMITGADGKSPIDLSPFEESVQDAVGQLIQMNGMKPIVCTPAQIYRIYAGKDSGDAINPNEIEDISIALDKMITTAVLLNFEEQMEKHKKIKRQPDYDYTKTVRLGTLINGHHDRKMTHSYNGTVIEDTFTIFEMPVLYAYSYAIRQIATVSKYLLTGNAPPAPGQKKSAQKKKKTTNQNRTQNRNLTSNDIDLRRYLLRYIEYQKNEKEKRNQKLKWQREPIPPYFEFFLPFETIARDLQYDTYSSKKMRTLREKTYAFMIEQMNNPDSAVIFADYKRKGKAFYSMQIRI